MPKHDTMNTACCNTYREWERVIIAANRDYDVSAFNMARVKYLGAIELANTMLDYAPCARPVIGALLVSYHNLADLYERVGQKRAAIEAHHSLSAIISRLSHYFPDSPVQCWGKQLAAQQFYLFQQRHGGVLKEPFEPATDSAQAHILFPSPLH